MKLWKRIILGLLLMLALLAIVVFQKMKETIDYANAFELVDLRLDNRADGIYEGESSWGLVKVRVRVVLKDHQLQRIDLLEHQNGLGTNAEQLLPAMISNNTIDLDVISGATISSKAIQNAIQNALQ